MFNLCNTNCVRHVFRQCAASLYCNVRPLVQIRKKSMQPHLVPDSCTLCKHCLLPHCGDFYDGSLQMSPGSNWEKKYEIHKIS
jgi:hypothetical protein